MNSKLKKPLETAKLNISSYIMKLKTDLATMQTLPQETCIVSFVLHLDYKFADESNVLFIAGLSNDWKKIIKNSGWLKSPLVKQTWLGTCQLMGDEVHLTVKKGKITRSQFNNAIKQNSALKKLNWIITEEISEGEDDDLLNDAPEETTKSAANNQDKAKADQINAHLVKLIPNLKGAAAEERQQLLAQIEKLANQLYAIPDWESYTNDSIERYLQQIETFLAQQESAETPAETATKLNQQLATYLNAFKKAATPTDKQKIMAAMQATAAKLYEVPDWEAHTDDKLEAILAQLPKSKTAENQTGDDTFIANHKAQINGLTTIEAVTAHSKTVAALASTPKQKEFADMVAKYAEHLIEKNTYINQNLDAQEELQQLMQSGSLSTNEVAEAQDCLTQLQNALYSILD